MVDQEVLGPGRCVCERVHVLHVRRQNLDPHADTVREAALGLLPMPPGREGTHCPCLGGANAFGAIAEGKAAGVNESGYGRVKLLPLENELFNLFVHLRKGAAGPGRAIRRGPRTHERRVASLRELLAENRGFHPHFREQHTIFRERHATEENSIDSDSERCKQSAEKHICALRLANPSNPSTDSVTLGLEKSATKNGNVGSTILGLQLCKHEHGSQFKLFVPCQGKSP